MLTPCGPSAVPTGGAGVACPPVACSLTIAVTCFFFAITRPPVAASPLRLGDTKAFTILCSDLFGLPVFQFDRSRSAEDFDQHGDLAVLFVDRLDRPFETLEGSFLNLDRVAAGQIDLDLLRLDLGVHLFAEHLVDFGLIHRARLTGRTGKVADAA